MVVIVAHGSRSRGWVERQWEWHRGVCSRVPSGFPHPELTFLEHAEPLFEDRLREASCRDESITVFPFFLSRSGHAGEEIPEMLEHHLPGRHHLLTASGWIDALGRNASRRLSTAGALTTDPIIVAGYGASQHQEEWLRLTREIQQATAWRDGPPWTFVPTGHFLSDYAAPLRSALAELRARGLRRTAVLPLFLSVSSYQQTLIPGVIAEYPDMQVAFQPDAILPDEELESWAAQLLLPYLPKD